MASTENPSLFSQKLRRLVKGRVKTEIDGGAGLRKGTISLILHRGNTPSLDDARRIANYFDVSMDWLFDESNDSLDPPRHSNPGYGGALDQFTTAALMDEVGKRYWPIAIEIEDGLAELKKYDTRELAKAAVRVVDGGALQDAQRDKLNKFKQLMKRLDELDEFDLTDYADLWETGHRPLNPRDIRPPQELREALWGDAEEWDELPHLIHSMLDAYEKSESTANAYMRQTWSESAVHYASEIRQKINKDQSET